MRGAFVVGVLRMMHQMGLDSNHFDAIYAVSSSVFAATYFSTGQVEQMESTWRYLVHGSQLIKLGNLFSKEGNAIDLDYLISLFRGRVYLDLEKLRTSRPRLIYVVTNMQSGSACYFSAKENIDLIFDLMMASASPRFLRRDSIHIDNCSYCDGGYSDPLPISKAILDGYTDLTVVLSRPKNAYPSILLSTILNLTSRHCNNNRYSFLSYWSSIKHLPKISEDTRVTVIQPPSFLLSAFSRSQDRIVSAIEAGKRQAEKVLFGQFRSSHLIRCGS